MRLNVCLCEWTFRSIARAVVIAAFLGIVSSAAAIDPQPVGKLIDIGGRKLHIHCTGSGSPSVIVENGGAAFSFDWELAQPEITPVHANLHL